MVSRFYLLQGDLGVLLLVFLFNLHLRFAFHKLVVNVTRSNFNVEIAKQICTTEKLNFLIRFICCYLIRCF